MVKQLGKLFLIASVCCYFLHADALPELPPLPSLGGGSLSTGVDVAAGDDSLSKQKSAKKDESEALDGRTNVVDTHMLDAKGKELSGSWWKKRHWLLKAREQQEKANAFVAQIQALGLPSYDAKRAAFNKDITSFYEKIGMDRGKVDALLDELSPYFYPAGKEAEGQLVTKGSSYLASGKKFQDYFDATVMVAQLKADLKAIADLDSGVSERVAQFEKTCQQAVQKAAEAQSTINEMFALVNHDAARDLYYKLEGIVAYLDAVLKFVKTDLASDLDRVIGLARTKMDEISKVVASARASCEKIKTIVETSEVTGDAAVDEKKEKEPSCGASSADEHSSENASVVEKTAEVFDFWGRVKAFLMSFI